MNLNFGYVNAHYQSESHTVALAIARASITSYAMQSEFEFINTRVMADFDNDQVPPTLIYKIYCTKTTYSYSHML